METAVITRALRLTRLILARLILIGLILSTPALAQDPAQDQTPPSDLPAGPALTARSFDALTLGKRFDTFDPNDLYGVEEFLPGQRSLWRDARGCKSATWYQAGDMICFRYEDDPENPDCWVYKTIDGVLWGWLDGQANGPTVRLIEGTTPMTCDWIGA
jgi:hypothetical protein